MNKEAIFLCQLVGYFSSSSFFFCSLQFFKCLNSQVWLIPLLQSLLRGCPSVSVRGTWKPAIVP